MNGTLTLLTTDGVYRLPADRSQVLTTELTALQFAARHLRHDQWSHVLRAERLAAGETVVVLPDTEAASPRREG